jgi:hypothetical protein
MHKFKMIRKRRSRATSSREETLTETNEGETVMETDNYIDDAQTYEQPPGPNADLERLSRLVGIWERSGGVQGTVTHEWTEGGFFLV